jgi:hypothetical protein
MTWHSRRVDNVAREICRCLLCRAAGAQLQSVRVPPDAFSTVPRWLHGDELIRWWAARADVRAQFEQLRTTRAMPRTTGETEPRR